MIPIAPDWEIQTPIVLKRGPKVNTGIGKEAPAGIIFVLKSKSISKSKISAKSGALILRQPRSVSLFPVSQHCD